MGQLQGKGKGSGKGEEGKWGGERRKHR